MEIEEIVRVCLMAIFKNDLFNETLYLKGGQAIRLKENIKTRFSADIDFSIEDHIEDPDDFESKLSHVLSEDFYEHDLDLFDFEMTKRPKVKADGIPDFWSGWQISFKLIQVEKKNYEIEKKRREAIVPKGAPSSKIVFDISEYEYCESIEKMTVDSIEVKTYSRVLLVLEKLRAICQQHPDYL
jgi:predicted nucleotidyltransferase component of viral defense system